MARPGLIFALLVVLAGCSGRSGPGGDATAVGGLPWTSVRGGDCLQSICLEGLTEFSDWLNGTGTDPFVLSYDSWAGGSQPVLGGDVVVVVVGTSRATTQGGIVVIDPAHARAASVKADAGWYVSSAVASNEAVAYILSPKEGSDGAQRMVIQPFSGAAGRSPALPPGCNVKLSSMMGSRVGLYVRGCSSNTSWPWAMDVEAAMSWNASLAAGLGDAMPRDIEASTAGWYVHAWSAPTTTLWSWRAPEAPTLLAQPDWEPHRLDADGNHLVVSYGAVGQMRTLLVDDGVVTGEGISVAFADAASSGYTMFQSFSGPQPLYFVRYGSTLAQQVSPSGWGVTSNMDASGRLVVAESGPITSDGNGSYVRDYTLSLFRLPV